MRPRITKVAAANREGSMRESVSCKVSSYPESERAYFQRMYGSDHLKQLHDGFMEEAIDRYALPTTRLGLAKLQQHLTHLTCENVPEMTVPGRSAYSVKLLTENILMYEQPDCRSLRWNEHYQEALASVAREVQGLLKGKFLKPMDIGDVAASESLQKNLDKNAGYFGFETNMRSKGENMDEAIKWCRDNMSSIMVSGRYDLPLVPSHRSSNSKPTSDSTWKWRCRVILMQDLRAMLLDGRFAVPFKDLFLKAPWGEGGMTREQVRAWIQINRKHYDAWYSSDYSQFDLKQAAWLLEDVMRVVVRPCFGPLSPDDEAMFDAMVNSYIHKEIHWIDGIHKVDGKQVSGALTTYCYNTIANEIIDRTARLMQGCDLKHFVSLKCGDDNLTYYLKREPWSPEEHCKLIYRYFGIRTTLGKNDLGSSEKDPHFLSRIWGFGGERRDIAEVVFNLVYPERFRCYDPAITGVTVRRAQALMMLCACLEQDSTMRQYFDVNKIREDAGIRISSSSLLEVYTVVGELGTGFNSDKIRYQLRRAG